QFFMKKQIFQFEDWFFVISISNKGKFFYTPEVLTKYRLHQESFTYNLIKKELLKYYSKIELYLNLINTAKNDFIIEKSKQKISIIIGDLKDAYEK
ncbi:hypothetical protein KY334_01955, partial [Candidatus Woesearchaeota archaeon]|nr:hypothetical protein [Candidatus Woesearchaeota archaeon]